MKDFLLGLRRGIPIGLGYLAVSFAFGVKAIAGLTPLAAILLSLTNLTSAGQFAGIEMIFSGASYVEIALTVFLINLRYSLMSVSLSQKLRDNTPTWKKLIFGFGVTDEVYAVAISEPEELGASYMFGIMIFPIIGWTGGTAIGALCASFFPARLLEALGIALYAMFIAIVLPDAKKSKAISIVCLISIAISCLFYYVPIIKDIGVGFKIIIATVVASLIGALVFPIHKDGEDDGKKTKTKLEEPAKPKEEQA